MVLRFVPRVLLCLLLALLTACSSGGPTTTRSPAGPATMPVSQLPVEARRTLALVDEGGPFPYAKDGAVFGNFEGLLPRRRRGYYHEYTVPTPGSRDRGARRIVTGQGGEIYYTADHYQSFEVVRR
ncbi:MULTISPECIES: ribonuclease domain-containing protein [unclassified Streptomyces]|uniref:ribonuclease domain-containing protein n=1 Tax=unclassified Streptomyces TaxID=2593676 RepID=UPI00115046BA|nr:ribonuclease domain-containing protein [Streptomyces sp. SLBN-31]TQJ86722.1 ribonuclease T1 [Streptomyces sp. SLBN-31]